MSRIDEPLTVELIAYDVRGGIAGFANWSPNGWKCCAKGNTAIKHRESDARQWLRDQAYVVSVAGGSGKKR